MNKVLEIKHLHKEFKLRQPKLFAPPKTLHALSDINLDVHENEVVGLIGESGCGKSTLARCVVGLHPPTSGEINYRGQSILDWSGPDKQKLRQRVQMIFQDPYSSLDSRQSVLRIIEEPLIIHGIMNNAKEREEEVARRMEEVGLNPRHRYRYPHEFSGGQRQRINIARALILKPDLVLCDEPVSALDVSVQAQVLNLFLELQEKYKLTYLFISHDLSVIRHLSDRIVIMYLGHIVEIATATELYANPLHPYTRALLSAIPPESPFETKQEFRLEGEVKGAIGERIGCPLQHRCPYVMPVCREQMPELKAIENGHQVACFKYQSS